MVNSISSSTLSVPTSTENLDIVGVNAVKTADRALHSLLQNASFLESLADQTSVYLPPTKGRIVATLWGMLNTNGGSFLTKDLVQKAIYAEGSGTRAGEALWTQLNPDKKSSLSAADFAFSDYLNSAIEANLESIQEGVEETRQATASLSGSSGTILDFFS